MWVNRDTGRLEMRAAVGVPEGWRELTQKIGEGVVGQAAERKKTILVKDTASAKEAEYLPFILGMRSELAVPVLDGGELLGVLNVEHPEVSAFDAEDAKLVEAAATQALIAIRNAQNYQAMSEAQKSKAMVETWAKLGEVSGTVAHRLGNNAGVIRIKVKELFKVAKDVEIVAKLETIERNNQYLLDLSEHMLKPAKAAMESLELMDINLLIRDAEKAANILSGIEVEMDLTEDLPEVRANSWFVEVFLELITNAVTAMEERPEKSLQICSRLADDDWIEVLVKDTGCGVAPNLKDSVFDLFVSGSEEAARRGQGFGLWWIRTFLADIGAQVELLESTLDKGSTFVVRLPPVVVG
jgi:signal transduction histidine kinase